jgi:hypothetical protein
MVADQGFGVGCRVRSGTQPLWSHLGDPAAAGAEGSRALATVFELSFDQLEFAVVAL